ncbi:MAG: GTP-binding protein [Candidatus Aminicenantia bacterium]
MPFINNFTKEIHLKIVYYGPGLGGKTTNLQYIHANLDHQRKGPLVTLPTETDRTLFFDFLPIDIGTLKGGFKVRCHFYTVPGQVYYNATRKLVLKGVDGLVFVADSQVERHDANLESIENLVENLKEYGYNFLEIPYVLQLNKRDLARVTPVEEMLKTLRVKNEPYFEAVAVKGIGVFETMEAIVKATIIKIVKGFGL